MRTPRLALLLAIFAAACGDDERIAEIRRVTEAQRPSAAPSPGTEEQDRAPRGYPRDLALVPGFRVESGTLEPGVARLASLYYGEMNVDSYRQALEAAMTARGGQRIKRVRETSRGSVRLRLEINGRDATAIVTPQGNGVRVDFIAMDRETTP